MYIYKMVYTERENFTDKEYKFLSNNKIIVETDYGTTEILPDLVQENKDNKKIINLLYNTIGTEKTDALLKNDIDLIMVVDD